MSSYPCKRRVKLGVDLVKVIDEGKKPPTGRALVTNFTRTGKYPCHRPEDELRLRLIHGYERHS